MTSNPLISVVSGTYQRLAYLKAMVESARRQLVGLEYQFVVVDGGSQDGTEAWCQQQADIVFIQQGALLGAINAFCAGAEAARGQYVLLANDDVSFLAGSILSAISHLETTPTCGQIAFADDRRAPGYLDTQWHVQTMDATGLDNRQTSVIYAQVSLTRRFLGDAVGWWGSKDSILSGNKTYGGDNFLSAGIYELGYTVDALQNCRVHDLVPQDSLRERNARIESQAPGRYYIRYPRGPKLVASPLLPNPQTERLRVLYLPIYEPGAYAQKEGKHGLRDAFARKGLVVELDYVNLDYDLPELVEQWQPHLLFMQSHSADGVPADALAKARALKPDMVVVNWNGDVYEDKLTSPDMLRFLKHVDLQLVVNHKVIAVYAANGIPSAYWQVAYEPVDDQRLPTAPPLDVVFLANCYSAARTALGQQITGMTGVNSGIYGRGWPGLTARGDTTYNFPAGAALYRSCKIAVGDNQYPDDYGFVSNRIFEALANGAFLLHQRVKGLEELTGIKEGVHYIAWENNAELERLIRHWLKPRADSQRAQIAAGGQAFVRNHHSFDARLDQLVHELLPQIERLKA